MKNSCPFLHQTHFSKNPIGRILAIAILITGVSFGNKINAQNPSLSFQGILKKASGEAVPDGNYNLVFKLYKTPTGGTVEWMENQSDLEVISGIYSTILGNIEPLAIPFNVPYYLGVTVGSTEMTPRIQLTSAPYALALIGTTNQFPSSGVVKADSIKVTGGVLADGGEPGLNGANRNGYAFSGTNGDKDSGLFSTADGEVSLYSNNTEVVEVTPGNMLVKGDATVNNVELPAEGKISYNGQDDWRLVDTDYFQNDIESWESYNPAGGEILGWNSSTTGTDPTLAGDNNEFEGKYIKQSGPNQVFKKKFNLASIGNYNFIKVKFKYHYLDSWDGQTEGDMAFAAIAETVTGTGMRIGYTNRQNSTNYSTDTNTSAFQSANNWAGNASFSDVTDNAEMTYSKCNSCNNEFWLFFGASLNSDIFPNPDESFGVGMIEIWVK